MIDLSTIALALIAPCELGDEIIAGARLLDVSTELGLRLRFEAGGGDVLVEIEPRDDSRQAAVRTRRFQVSYRVGDRARPVDDALGHALCVEIGRRASANEAEVQALIEGGIGEEAAAEGSLRVREVRTDRLLEPWGTPGERYYTLSPYVGCLIGCHFCYAQSRLQILRRLQGLPEVPWGSWVDARVNAPARLAIELSELKPLPIKFCAIVSDPYQAIERRYRLTRGCLEVLRAASPRPVIVLTRASLIRDDAELLASMPAAYAGFSVPTIDDRVREHFEPRGAPIAERLAAMSYLRDRGVRTFAIVQPILPGSLEGLADALAERVGSARIDVLRGVEGARSEFADPRYAEAADDAWQEDRAGRLAELLLARGVRIWLGELPPSGLARP